VSSRWPSIGDSRRLPATHFVDVFRWSLGMLLASEPFPVGSCFHVRRYPTAGVERPQLPIKKKSIQDQ